MKSTSRLTAGLAAVSLMALALAGCSSPSPSPSASKSSSSPDAAELVKVKVAVLAPGALQWLQAIAEDQGFYKKHGVAVEAIQVQSSSALVQAVSSGSADAGISLGDNVIKAVDEGADISMTGALFQRPALRLFGASGVSTISDLKGKKVTAGATTGGTADLMFYLLKQAGVDPKSVVPVAIANSSDRVVAMKNGQVGGALLIPPFDSVAKAQGATLLATYDHYYVETPAIVNNGWAKKNPKGAAGFTQGLQDAAKWIYGKANKSDAVRILEDYAHVDKSNAQDAYDFMIGQKIISPDLSIPESGLTNIAKVSADINGGDVSNFDPKKYIDTQYLK